MKRTILLLAVAVAVGAGIYYFIQSRAVEATNEIRLTGNIEVTQVDVAFKAPGKIVGIAVGEGDTVREGMELARQDVETMRRQRTRDAAGVGAAESQIQQLGTLIEWQKENLERDLDVRAAEVQQAQARLNDLLAGARPQELQQTEAALAEARTQHELASKDWDRAERLYKAEDITTAQYDQARTRFNATRSAMQQAEQRMAIVREGPRENEIAAARAALDRAQKAVRLAETNRLEIRRKEQEMGARRAELARSRAQVSVIESQIDDSVLTSPVNGVVLVKSADTGEMVNAGVPILSIGDLSKPWVRAYVSESELGKVKIGTSVRVTTDSFPGKEYRGRVTFISPESEFTPKQIQTADERVKLVYRIKVEVENPNQELKVNMPVDAVIATTP